MDLHRQFATARRWLPLLVVAALLAGGLAFLGSSLMPKIFEAKATLIVGQSLSAVSPDINQLLASQRLSSTYASLATTRPVLERAIEELGLSESASDLSKRVWAEAPLDSTLVIVTAQDPDPAGAAAIANAVARQLVAASPSLQGRAAELEQSIDEDLRSTQDDIKTTQAKIEDLISLPERTAAEDRTLEILQGRLVTLRSTYATLLSFSSSNASNQLSIVEPAIPTDSPVLPRTLLNTMLAVAIGLLLAATVAFIAEHMNDTIRDPQQVRELVGLPTLGSIVRMRGGSGRSEIYRLPTILYPRSLAAEAYRSLRVGVDFSAVDAPIRTLLVTSASQGDGKTVTAANLAVAFAQTGRRTLLVDADLRQPSIHLLFDTGNASGLSSLLRSDEASLDAVACQTEQENLRVLSSGPLPPNPAELLGSQRMQQVLARLQLDNDLVVFDSPPLQAVADSAILSSFLDGTILVIDASRSRPSAVRRACDALDQADARVLGAVLNRLPERFHSDYQSYYDSVGGIDERARVPEKAPGGSVV